MATDSEQRGFLKRSNDLSCRDFSCRAFRFVRSLVRRTAQGAILLADEPRTWRAWRNGWEAQHHLQLLRLKEEGFRPKVFYDIGAHRGIWSEMCQQVLSPAKCILFEPQQQHHAEIRSRHSRAGGDWKLLPYALGDADGETTMHVNQQSAASSLLAPAAASPREYWGVAEVRQDPIQVRALDSLVAAESLPAPDLVKLDVQGFEARVLAGGAVTLRKASRIVIEVSLKPLYEGQVLFPEIVKTMTDWGFEVEDITEALRGWPRGGLWQADLWLKKRPSP